MVKEFIFPIPKRKVRKIGHDQRDGHFIMGDSFRDYGKQPGTHQM